MKEVVNIIPYYIAICISTIIYDLSFSKLSEKVLKINIKNIIVILVSSILILWNNVYDNMIIKAILNIVIIVGNYKIIFKENIRKIIIKYIVQRKNIKGLLKNIINLNKNRDTTN